MMKKKDLINLIKTKSAEIEVKDFSSNILERVKDLSRPELIVTEKRHFRFNLKQAFAVTLGTLATVLLIMVFYNPSTPIIPTDPQFESMDNAIVFSAISTSALIDLAEDELVINAYETLAGPPFGNNPDPKIDQEIIDVAKYFEVMEKLLASQNDFNIEKEDLEQSNYGQRMRFKTIDFLNQEVQYRMDYNQNRILNTDRFTLEGIVEVGEVSYLFTGTGEENDAKQLAMKVSKDELNYIDVEYRFEDAASYFNIKITKNGEIFQDVTLIVEETNTVKNVEMYFNEGASIGTYKFSMGNEANQNVLKINYLIEGDLEESGELIVRVSTLQNQNIYSILVKPEGRVPYIIQKNRSFSGRPRQTESIDNQINL